MEETWCIKSSKSANSRSQSLCKSNKCHHQKSGSKYIYSTNTNQCVLTIKPNGNPELRLTRREKLYRLDFSWPSLSVGKSFINLIFSQFLRCGDSYWNHVPSLPRGDLQACLHIIFMMFFVQWKLTSGTWSWTTSCWTRRATSRLPTSGCARRESGRGPKQR